MNIKVMIALTLFLAAFSAVAYVFYAHGQYMKSLGENQATIHYQEATRKMLERDEQEVIHDVLGKYQGNYTDNESYDHTKLNRLFE